MAEFSVYICWSYSSKIPRHNPFGMFYPLAILSSLFSDSNRILPSTDFIILTFVAVVARLFPYMALLFSNVLFFSRLLGYHPNHITAPPLLSAVFPINRLLAKLDAHSFLFSRLCRL